MQATMMMCYSWTSAPYFAAALCLAYGRFSISEPMKKREHSLYLEHGFKCRQNGRRAAGRPSRITSSVVPFLGQL